MKKIYIALIFSVSIILTVAVIAAFHYGLVLAASRIPWLLISLAIALLLVAMLCGTQYAFNRVVPERRPLVLALAVGNAALGLSGLLVALWGPPTSMMMKWLLPSFVIVSLILFKGLVLRSSVKRKSKNSLP